MSDEQMDSSEGVTGRKVEQQRPTVEVDGLPLSEGFPIRKITLRVTNGQDAGREVVSDRPTLRLGADPLCDFVLSDPTVSRNHAEVRMRGGNYVLVDLNSTNGTFISDERVSQHQLTDGQTFRLGRTELILEVRTEKVAIRTTQRTQYDNIIGQSQALREIFSILDRVSPSELSVVIEGETGSGKELIARAIHDHSTRSDGPFVVFDCSAFPPSLLESELFGHEKGAFTGAVGRHVGVFERADGGTLFFDELGELDLEFQAKFLRVLETGQLRRVGGEKVIEVEPENREALASLDTIALPLPLRSARTFFVEVPVMTGAGATFGYMMSNRMNRQASPAFQAGGGAGAPVGFTVRF